MIELVLDANVALDWFLPSEAGAAYSQPLAVAAAKGNVRFHVPLHFDVEVCGQLVKVLNLGLALIKAIIRAGISMEKFSELCGETFHDAII